MTLLTKAVNSAGLFEADANLLFTNVVNGAGNTLTASGSFGIQFNTAPYSHLGVFVNVAGAVTGTTPTLNVTAVGIDQDGGQYFLGDFGTALTAAGAAAFGVGPGTANQFIVPRLAVVTYAITGSTPSFGNVKVYVYGRS